MNWRNTIWKNRRVGGSLHTYLRQNPKQLRKGYDRYHSRGKLAGKRPIADRLAGAHNRSRMGHGRCRERFCTPHSRCRFRAGVLLA
jgi:hypothetical protein